MPIDAGEHRYAGPLRDHAQGLRGRLPHDAEIVLLGSLVETKWLERGDQVVIGINGLGRVSMALDQAVNP